MKRIEADMLCKVLPGRVIHHTGPSPKDGEIVTTGSSAVNCALPGIAWRVQEYPLIAINQEFLEPIPDDSTWLSDLISKPVEVFGSQEYKWTKHKVPEKA
jgi:hypothetical protein